MSHFRQGIRKCDLCKCDELISNAKTSQTMTMCSRIWPQNNLQKLAFSSTPPRDGSAAHRIVLWSYNEPEKCHVLQQFYFQLPNALHNPNILAYLSTTKPRVLDKILRGLTTCFSWLGSGIPFSLIIVSFRSGVKPLRTSKTSKRTNFFYHSFY